ncbi:alpha/beta hydrolase [Bradyrhizobium sp. NBAIM14]|uniref:alpha/beta fold hydrolase n=1 Tax=Bradyrhizobium sp. NBAIM14 TaxID=2793814 RepID=UPI001CD2E0B9|nr:alpha/beta hydrolase [Bradyrhizobium sp. NBAIM14]
MYRHSMSVPIRYRYATVEGLKVFYRVAGPASAPVILALHGVPSSSRMYDPFMRKLAPRYRLIAPDYIGFGNSDTPPPNKFTYTFDNLAAFTLKFADILGLRRFTLLMQDYGGPVGMRMATARPEAVRAMIFQNANVYDEGLGLVWETRRPFWSDRSAHEATVRQGALAPATVRNRHLGSDPNTEAYDPDLWMDELAYLHRPGIDAIQAELIYDYQNNLASYPTWQAWLREHKPPSLILWGRYDQSFIPPGADAFKRDLPDAKVVLLEGGHFVMDTCLDEVAEETEAFMRSLPEALGYE